MWVHSRWDWGGGGVNASMSRMAATPAIGLLLHSTVIDICTCCATTLWKTIYFFWWKVWKGVNSLHVMEKLHWSVSLSLSGWSFHIMSYMTHPHGLPSSTCHLHVILQKKYHPVTPQQKHYQESARVWSRAWATSYLYKGKKHHTMSRGQSGEESTGSQGPSGHLRRK